MIENILNSMADPVHITNRNFEVEFVNRACSEIFGPHTNGIKCYKYFHDFDGPCGWCRHEEVMAGKSYHSENYFKKADKYFDSKISPIINAGGDPAKLVILRDVTERKDAENRLMRRNDEKTALLTAIHAVLLERPYKTRARIIFDSFRQLVRATAGYIELFNKDRSVSEILFSDSDEIQFVPRSALPGRTGSMAAQVSRSGGIVIDNDFQNGQWKQFIPQCQAPLSNVMLVPLSLDSAAVGLLVLADKEGGFSDEDASIAKAFGELAAIALTNSQLIDAMVVNMEEVADMTRRLHAEISEKNKAVQDLKRSEEQFRTLVNNIEQRHFIYNHNPEGVFTYLSPSVTEILGYSPGEFMSHYETYLTDHPVNKSAREFTELGLRGKAHPPYELEIYHKDGRKIWLEVVELPVTDIHGGVTGLQGIAQDISARKSAREIHLMNTRFEAMRKLIAGLSHAIRNPLFGISSISQILQRADLDEKYAPMIRALNTESKRIADLINDLNMYAKPKAPVLSLIDMGSLIDTLKQKYSEKYPEITFRVNLESAMTVKGDESQLSYAIDQLLENGCQSGATELDIDIHRDYYFDGDRVNFSIRDNGTGISEKDILKCFDPFYTTRQRSTGLGLSLSKKLIELHGGSIDLSSKAGEGTSIFISLNILPI
ncbi:MAG: PAS domain S-box protein [Nitrospirae bacterium]|nr:PAS domain S-box protein [Nitrospirota bacterium]